MVYIGPFPCQVLMHLSSDTLVSKNAASGVVQAEPILGVPWPCFSAQLHILGVISVKACALGRQSSPRGV